VHGAIVPRGTSRGRGSCPSSTRTWPRTCDELGRRGARIHLGQTVTAADVRDDGQIGVTTDAGSQERADAVLSSGRLASTVDLDVEKIGLVRERQGRLAVDPFFRTAVPHVYAVGDVIGFPALASTSMEQGRTAVSHALRDQLAGRPDVLPFDDSLPYALLPYGLHTIQSVAMIGVTEDQLRSDTTRARSTTSCAPSSTSQRWPASTSPRRTPSSSSSG
jgi:pyruvate/2-oxoglutarate dehydrogenase complex dihydrolipoamide dehydrogenase (E3) component